MRRSERRHFWYESSEKLKKTKTKKNEKKTQQKNNLFWFSWLIEIRCFVFSQLSLGPSINGNTKLCCRGIVFGLFQTNTACKINFKHTQDYTKLFPVCKVEILQVTVNEIEVFIIFLGRFLTIIGSKWYLGFLLIFIKTDKLSRNITIHSLR